MRRGFSCSTVVGISPTLGLKGNSHGTDHRCRLLQSINCLNARRHFASEALGIFLAISSKTLLASASSSLAGVAGATKVATASNPLLHMACVGALARLVTLPLTVYADVHCTRAANVLPDLQKAFFEYVQLVDTKMATVWEKRIGADRLHKRRERLFEEYGTGNYYIATPIFLSGLLNFYFATTVMPHAAKALGLAGTAAMPAAGEVLLTTSPLAVTAGTATVDLIFPLSACLTATNCLIYISHRRGFNDGRDTNLNKVLIFTGSVALVGSFAGLLGYVPVYAAAYMLGVSCIGAFQHLFWYVPRLRRAVGIQEYPSIHGTYGDYNSAVAMLIEGPDENSEKLSDEERWEKHKLMLEYECDVHIHNTARKMGILPNKLQELEYEKKLVERRLLNLKKEKEKKGEKLSPDAEAFLDSLVQKTRDARK